MNDNLQTKRISEIRNKNISSKSPIPANLNNCRRPESSSKNQRMSLPLTPIKISNEDDPLEQESAIMNNFTLGKQQQIKSNSISVNKSPLPLQHQLSSIQHSVSPLLNIQLNQNFENISSPPNLCQKADSCQDGDIVTIPEEDCGDSSIGLEQLRYEAPKIQSIQGISEKLKKYDGMLQIRPFGATAYRNPLLKNKGAILDDWGFASSRKSKLWDIKSNSGKGRQRATKSFHQTSQIAPEKAEHTEHSYFNSFEDTNSKNVARGISNKPTQLGFNSGQVSLYPKSSTKNANLSLFHAFQSTQHLGSSNNFQLSRLVRAPSNMKESNNHLTLKTINDQMWEYAMRVESNCQPQQQMQHHNRRGVMSREQYLHSGPLYSQLQLSNLNNTSHYSQEQSASRRQKQEQLSSDRIQSQINHQTSDQEEQKLGQGVGAPSSLSQSSPRQKAPYLPSQNQQMIQAAQDKMGNRSKPSSLAPSLSKTNIQHSHNLQTFQKQYLEDAAHQLSSLHLPYSPQQTPLQNALSQSQLVKQHTNQVLCENLIYEENQESSADERAHSILVEEVGDNLVEGEILDEQQEVADPICRGGQARATLQNRRAHLGYAFEKDYIFYEEDEEDNCSEDQNSHPKYNNSSIQKYSYQPEYQQQFSSCPLDEINKILERSKSRLTFPRNDIIEEVLEEDLSPVQVIQAINLPDHLNQNSDWRDINFKPNTQGQGGQQQPVHTFPRHHDYTQPLNQQSNHYSNFEEELKDVSNDEESGDIQQDLDSVKKSQTAFYLRRRKRESLLVAKRQYLQRTKTQSVFTVRSHEIQLSKLSKSYVYLAKGLSQEIGNIDQFSQIRGLGSALGTFGVVNYNSIFFEKDMNLELYKKTLKDALAVQFQKEKNISHQVIKKEYDSWVANFQLKYQKTSPHKKTIVFDLDETLVRAQDTEFQDCYDSKIRVIESEKKEFMIYVKLRPGLSAALQTLKENFELILFTAASTQYANIVLQTFDGSQYFDHILSRNQCLFIEQYKVYIKDLQILTMGRDLENVIIVDNKIESFCSHLENGIPIKSYYGEEGDDRLNYLVSHLMRLRDVEDVREHIMNDFFLQELKDNFAECQGDCAQLREELINECVDNDRQRYKRNRRRAQPISMANLTASLRKYNISQNSAHKECPEEEFKEEAQHNQHSGLQGCSAN